MQTKDYRPQRIFETSDYAVLLLNTRIGLEDEFFLKIWNNAVVRHTVDGGANHFFELLDKQPEHVRASVKFPDIASGDFDSISGHSMNRLKDTQNAGKCKIVLTEDQDETDFTKALRVLQEELISTGRISSVKSVIAFCEFGGRLDQIISNLNTLHKHVFTEESFNHSPTVYIISSDTLSWLLPANFSNTITFENVVPNYLCGILPFQGPTKFVSTGLKWDLSTDLICQFGGLVSTSNKVIAKVVQITPLDKHSIFSVELVAVDYVM